MGLIRRISSVAAPARRGSAWDALDDRWYVPPGWIGGLTQAGVRMSPDLAMTLSAVWCAVTTIADDVSTLPCLVYRYLDNGGKDRARNHPLAYVLRWQPNRWQTAKEFWGMLIGHQLLRGNAYARILEGPRGFADQLVPMHPDRVRPERLPSGDIVYRLVNEFNPDGSVKTLTQDEVYHLRDLTSDGVVGMSRVAYGLNSFGAMAAAEGFAQHFFKAGATPAVIASVKGDPSDEQLEDHHKNIQRYLGTKNAGGVLVIEEDMTIEKLGVNPQEAQLLETRQASTKDVARWFKMPGHKLEAEAQTQAYAAREAANLEYVIGTLRPLCVNIEQVNQRDLILARDAYFTEFLLEALLRGDTAARADYYTKAIRNRWMNPNEVRLRENLNPYTGGDEYCPWNTASAADNGSNARAMGDGGRGRQQPDARAAARALARASVLGYEAGLRIIKREQEAVRKASARFANDGEGWSKWLRAFYDDHAAFVAETLRIPRSAAREYAAEHGTALERLGVKACEDWDTTEAALLGEWAINPPAPAAEEHAA